MAKNEGELVCNWRKNIKSANQRPNRHGDEKATPGRLTPPKVCRGLTSEKCENQRSSKKKKGRGGGRGQCEKNVT